MSDLKKLIKEKSKFLSLGKYQEVAEICNAIGNEFENQERYEEALEQHIEELEYCELTGDQLSIAVANRKIGESYAFLCKFNEAFEYIQKYYDMTLSLNSVVEQQRAHSTLGRTFYLKYQHEITSGLSYLNSKTLDHALLEYLKAYKLLHEIGTDIKPDEFAEMKCRLLLNMGLVLENCKDYDACCKRIKEGLDIAVRYHLHEDIQRCGLALGTIHHKLGNYPEASRSLDVALSAAKKLNNKNMTCEILLHKGLVLISMEDFDAAKKYLKTAFKLHSSNEEDHNKVKKSLKTCIGISNVSIKLKSCFSILDKKNYLEKIADGLSSINCFKLAIKYYLKTIDCMENINAAMSEKAPLYFSLAKSYLDDDNVQKALEYFEKEFSCHDNKPVEQVSTLWEIADALAKINKTDKMEEIYLKAISIAEKTSNQKVLHNSLNKLLSFYEKLGKQNEANTIKRKLDDVLADSLSDEDDTEDSPDIFSDIDLNDLSDSDCEELASHSRRRHTKNIESKVNVKGETPLHQACINGNLTMVKKLVESGHSINIRDYCGWTPLHEACNLGFYEIAEYLIEKGADVNDPGGTQCGGITALHDAASCGHLDIMALLIAKGARVTAIDYNGETPLHALLHWKQRAGDINDVTLKQCKAIESELKKKMEEMGMNADITVASASNRVTEMEWEKVGEKRARSLSLSPKIVSDEEENTDCVYFETAGPGDWDSAESAKAEYKSVMKNLRRSAAGSHTVKKLSPVVSEEPPLVNENEIVDQWLIKDTNIVKKVKRKKRRLNKLKVRTSKRIDDFLIHEDSNSNHIIDIPCGSDEDSSFSISSVSSSGNDKESNPIQDVKNENMQLSFCLRVKIHDKLILVPVSDEIKPISWLAEEAALRYQSLEGKKPHLILTKNGALLSGSDLIKDIFCNNEEVISVVDSWDEPSIEERFVQLCIKRNLHPSSDIKKILQCTELSAALDISNCSISPSHFSAIFLSISNFRSLVHLNMSGTVINSSTIKDFLVSIPCFLSLQTLSMSCCGITSESLKKITDYLQSSNQQNFFPELKILDLSYNSFSSNSCFSVFLGLNSLISLSLSSCSLTSALFANPTFCNVLTNKHNLEELNLSGNKLDEIGISNYLHLLPKLSLKKLNLKHTVGENVNVGGKIFSFIREDLPFLTELVFQGCFLTDSDLKQISLCMIYCQHLQNCDLSENNLLSRETVSDFLDKICKNCSNLTELNVSGTCSWDEENFLALANILNLVSLKHLIITNYSDYVSQNLIKLWERKWPNMSDYFDCGFLDLVLN